MEIKNEDFREINDIVDVTEDDEEYEKYCFVCRRPVQMVL